MRQRRWQEQAAISCGPGIGPDSFAAAAETGFNMIKRNECCIVITAGLWNIRKYVRPSLLRS